MVTILDQARLAHKLHRQCRQEVAEPIGITQTKSCICGIQFLNHGNNNFMRNFLSILTAFLLPLSASAFVSQVYTTNNAATVDAHVLAVVGGGVTATNSIANNSGVGTNLTVYGTLTSTNLNAAISSATNSALALASNSFYGIGNVSNFQTFLQVSNTIQSATNGFSGGGISAVTATNIANASALAATIVSLCVSMSASLPTNVEAR